MKPKLEKYMGNIELGSKSMAFLDKAMEEMSKLTEQIKLCSICKKELAEYTTTLSSKKVVYLCSMCIRQEQIKRDQPRPWWQVWRRK